MGNNNTKSKNEPEVSVTFSQHNNITELSTQSKGQQELRSNSKYQQKRCLPKREQSGKLDDFLKICSDFENALKTVRVNQRSKNSVHQRLLNIHKTLVEMMSTLEKSNNNKSNKTMKKKKDSSNLKSQNKSLSSSTSHLHSKKPLKRLQKSPLSKEFLKGVNCSFCNERQPDKYYLIKHLDESCIPFKKEIFEKETNLPFSFFQILPNNCIKCNICPNEITKGLLDYFNHFNSSSHKENLKIRSSSKSYCDSLFCSVCKVLVPNNCTELLMHLQHNRHRKRNNKVFHEKIFKEKKICCIYYVSQEFYCFVCSKKFGKKKLQDFMEHVIKNEHKQNLEKHAIMATKAYCQFCEKEINTFEIWDHFQSLEHESKILEETCSQYYTLCVYCASDFSDLAELSSHIKSGCKEMEILRKENLTSGPEATSGKSREIEKGVGGKPEVKDGHCLFIDVSDGLDVSDLKDYFENFGRIISFNKLTGNKFMIVFKEGDVVGKILRVKDSICFNGKILAVSESMSETVEKQSAQKENECESNDDDDDDDEDGNDDDDDYYYYYYDEGASDDDDDSASDDGKMENLFQEVGFHLLKKIETMNSSDENEILLNAQTTLTGTVTFSGFRDCQLFLPGETRLNLYCDSLNFLLLGLGIYEGKKNLLTDYTVSNKLENMLLLIDKSSFWENAECIPGIIPYVKCVHKRSRKSCIISFSKPDRVLTDALRACVKENDAIRPFLLTLKLWLSSQETFLTDLEYPVIAVILLFLMNKSLVRPFSVTQTPVHFKILRALPDDRDLNATGPVNSVPEGDIKKLFQMFLEFLKTFDFKNYAVCFPIPRPVPRTILKEVLNFKDDSSICIMDAWCNWNYMPNVSETESRSFLKLVNKTLQEM